MTILACAFSVAIIFLAHVSARLDAADTVNVNLYVDGCNNNYVCEAVIGEDANTCPLDCAPAQPDPTPEEDDRDGRSGDRKVTQTALEIDVNTIVVLKNSIEVTWRTNLPANGSVEWSSGPSYNIGSLREIGFTREHSFTLTGLAYDSQYVLTLTATDLYGRTMRTSVLAHTEPMSVPTPSVENATVTQQNDGSVLQWKNPSHDFEYVRIMKSENFFPQDPFDGELIYEGGAQSFFDSEVFEGVRYFYSIFAKGPQGFSEGSLRSFVLKSDSDFFGTQGEPVTVFGPIYDFTKVTDIDKSDLYGKFTLTQNGVETSRAGNVFYVKNNADVFVTVDKAASIPATADLFISYFPTAGMTDSQEYVLKFDSESQKFITSFTVSNIDQSAPFILYIRNNEEITGYIGYLSVELSALTSEKQNFVKRLFSNDLFASLVLLSFFLLLLLALLVILLSKKDEKNQ